MQNVLALQSLDVDTTADDAFADYVAYSVTSLTCCRVPLATLTNPGLEYSART